MFDELEDEDEGWTLVDLKLETREFDDYVLVEKPRAMSYEWSAEVGLRVSGQPPLLRIVEGAHRPITQEEKKARQVVEDKNERCRAELQRAMDSGAQMAVLTEEDEEKYCSAALNARVTTQSINTMLYNLSRTGRLSSSQWHKPSFCSR